MRRETSVNSLAQEAEQAKIRVARNAARSPTLTDTEIIEGLRRQMDGKIWWLEKHSTTGRWSQNDIDRKTSELAVLVQAHDRIKTLEGSDAPAPP
ncbi:hypothetical protein [Rhizobium sp. 18065]|uniref:hypothetical protein n=1 Tax=Rhizobium sp. 18065 TaxID=2681411 RepID=UPI00135864F7|nr:hypothetical protein [Rhizobium sp. 18065]